jgi:conjugal transfer pilin signal peptidase TrbI
MDTGPGSPPRINAKLGCRSPRLARWILLACCAALLAGLTTLRRWRDNHALLINASTSLPNWAFFVDRAAVPARGDLIFFSPPPSALLTRHFGANLRPFGKRVLGTGGDRVSVRGRLFMITGRPVARAKAASRLGEPLALGPVGVIPPGCYFVATAHPDSFDSRYAAIGWICRSRILGVGRAIL